MAAHFSASFAPSCSSLLGVTLDASSHASALFEASNSTGSVINENKVVKNKAPTPIAKIQGLPENTISITPAISTHDVSRDAMLTTGTIAERNCNHEYAVACCTACPHSWAATAAAATLRPWYTSGLRFTVLLAGL